ncbi:MAG: ABC transporter ATP-binding protein [Planctomycetota bacterium]
MSDPAETVIELDSIDMYYGEGDASLHVLKGVNIVVREGEYVAITGASGSGKSTMLNILGCLDRATNGRYILHGADVADLDDDELSHIRNDRIGFIFQSFNLIAGLNVLENIEVPVLYSSKSIVSRRARCKELLAAVGLTERMHHKPPQLSGGERQRVAIARSLVNDPVLLLADEPTGNLDTKTGNEVLTLMEDLHKQGRTIVMITHDPIVAARAQRQIHLIDGVVQEPAA